MNIQVQLIDTPPIDREFVEPAFFDLIRHSDLILLVVDLQADPIHQMEAALVQLNDYHIAPVRIEGQISTEPRIVNIPLIVLVNKCDDPSMDELFELCFELLQGEWTLLPVSALTWRNFETLKQMVYDALGIIRVYAQPPGKEPDLGKPFVLKKGSTVIQLAEKVHRDFHEHLKTARVWGSTAFDGQMVQRDYVLQEGDIIELRT